MKLESLKKGTAPKLSGRRVSGRCLCGAVEDVYIHGAHPRIIQHIILEGLALDCDSADGTPRPEEPAHALTPGFC